MKAKNSPKALRIGILLLAAFVVGRPAGAFFWTRSPVGGLFDLSGANAAMGDAQANSMKMAVAAINRDGGIDGQKLKALIYDTEGRPGPALEAAERLVRQKKVLAVIGPSLTGTTLAIEPMLIKAEMPFISCAAGHRITRPVTPWGFQTAQCDGFAVAAVYAELQRQGLQRIGILTVSNAYGVSGRDQLRKQAENFGIQVVADETYANAETEMSSQLQSIRTAVPQALVCWGTAGGSAAAVRSARQLGMDVPILLSHGAASPEFVRLAGDAAEGVMMPSGKIAVADRLDPDDPQKSVLLDYREQYEKRHPGSAASGFGGYAYDAMTLLGKAMAGAEGNRHTIRDNLESIQGHVGVSGIFNFSAADHNGLGPESLVMVRIQKGNWRVLGPAGFRQDDLPCD